MTQLMTQAQAQLVVMDLANRFGMNNIPTVRCAGTGSRAYFSRNEIVLGKGWSGKEDCPQKDVLLHEFAHFLDHHRGTYDRRNKHGLSFYRALKDTILFAYKDLALYRWEFDYYKVYANARREGLTSAYHRLSKRGDLEMAASRRL